MIPERTAEYTRARGRSPPRRIVSELRVVFSSFSSSSWSARAYALSAAECLCVASYAAPNASHASADRGWARRTARAVRRRRLGNHPARAAAAGAIRTAAQRHRGAPLPTRGDTSPPPRTRRRARRAATHASGPATGSDGSRDNARARPRALRARRVAAAPRTPARVARTPTRARVPPRRRRRGARGAPFPVRETRRAAPPNAPRRDEPPRPEAPIPRDRHPSRWSRGSRGEFGGAF